MTSARNDAILLELFLLVFANFKISCFSFHFSIFKNPDFSSFFFLEIFMRQTTVFLHSIFGKTGAVGVDIGAAEPDGQLPGKS